MLGVCIIPTGVGAEIGGHSGDGTAAARLLSSACDTLIVHPNVVNASDINEMTPNMLYVEGNMLDKFLEGSIGLRRVKNNKILLVTNNPVKGNVVNSVSAARVTLGLDISILPLKTPLRMIGTFKDGVATGDVFGWEKLVEQVQDYTFDALAIHTAVELSREVRLKYYREGGVNPWGGIEAKCSRLIGNALGKPVAHAPAEDCSPSDTELYTFSEIVDPRIAPELVSVSYLHCLMKGLHKAPRIGNEIFNNDVDFMVSPFGCVGRPHFACISNRIPVIIVKENKTCLNDVIPTNFLIVENYLEAVGVIQAMREGISLESVRRPIGPTVIHTQ